MKRSAAAFDAHTTPSMTICTTASVKFHDLRVTRAIPIPMTRSSVACHFSAAYGARNSRQCSSRRGRMSSNVFAALDDQPCIRL